MAHGNSERLKGYQIRHIIVNIQFPKFSKGHIKKEVALNISGTK